MTEIEIRKFIKALKDHHADNFTEIEVKTFKECANCGITSTVTLRDQFDREIVIFHELKKVPKDLSNWGGTELNMARKLNHGLIRCFTQFTRNAKVNYEINFEIQPQYIV